MPYMVMPGLPGANRANATHRQGLASVAGMNPRRWYLWSNTLGVTLRWYWYPKKALPPAPLANTLSINDTAVRERDVGSLYDFVGNNNLRPRHDNHVELSIVQSVATSFVSRRYSAGVSHPNCATSNQKLSAASEMLQSRIATSNRCVLE